MGVTPVEAKEVLYQAVPYVGIAKVVDFIAVTNEIKTDRGVQLPLPVQSTTTPETRIERGLAIQKKIIGDDVVEKLDTPSPADQMHLQRLLSANGFGDHYTRAGLDIQTHELMTLSTLAPLGGCDPQVKRHVAANLPVDNTRALLIDVVTQLLPFIGYPRTLNALRAINISHCVIAGDFNSLQRETPGMTEHLFKVLVVGATSSIGRLVVAKASEMGTLFARMYEALKEHAGYQKNAKHGLETSLFYGHARSPLRT